jgi:hypothetical protein
MRKNNYPVLISVSIAIFAVALLIFTPSIQWIYLYKDFFQENHNLHYYLLKGFNFWGTEASVLNGLRFFFALLLFCYITKLILEKPREVPQLLILVAVVGFLFSFVIGPSFFKFSSICSFLLLGLAVFSKKRENSVFLTAFALMTNVTIALPFVIVLSIADQFRQFKFIFRPRFFLVMIDGGLLALVLFIATFLFANHGNL